MSRLQRLNYDLKGQQRCVDLAPVVLVTGPNGSGKSTFLQAISAGLRGLAQSPGDLEKVYLGPERAGAVSLTFDTGIVVRPDLSKVSDKDSKRADYDAERIAGRHLVRWDLADFATISDTNREKLLRSICGNIQATSLQLPKSPLFEQLLRVERLEQDAGTWLERSLKWLAERYTEFNSALKTATEGAKAAGEAAEKEAPSGTLSGAKEELERLQKEVAELRAQQQTAARDAAHVRATETRRQQAAERHAEVEAERDALAVQLQQPAPDVAGLKAAMREAEAALEAAVQRNRAAQSKAAQGDAPHKVLAKLEAQQTGIEGQIVALTDEMGAHCAHCGAADPLAIGARIATLRAQVGIIEESLKDAREEVEFADRAAQRRMESHQAASQADLAAGEQHVVHAVAVEVAHTSDLTTETGAVGGG